ncbi:hypothetical protein [Agrococcus pavilionensis]|uniref:hypothetical protein n=1 Tax=Agrococcus pavilionensis TaxID=1346502 RepID=UPI001181B4BE|nr:hypothetical protein [Agrococcus pavilionensis]
MSQRLGLHELHAASPAAMGLWTHGYDVGVGTMREPLLQARRDSDRAWLYAMNGKERAAEFERRMTRAIASCPPDVEPHGVAYFTHVLRGAAGLAS